MPETFVELDETQKFLLPGILARPHCNFPPFRPLPEGWNVGSPNPPLQLWFQGAIGDLCKVILSGIRNLPGEHCQLLIPHTPLTYASPSSCKLIAALNFHHICLLLLAVQLGKKKPGCCYRDHQTEWHQNICTTATECSRVPQHSPGGHAGSETPLSHLSCPAELQGGLISWVSYKLDLHSSSSARSFSQALLEQACGLDMSPGMGREMQGSGSFLVLVVGLLGPAGKAEWNRVCDKAGWWRQLQPFPTPVLLALPCQVSQQWVLRLLNTGPLL